jgi:L-aminopeptidase/D-esterase-like protein
MKNFKIGHYTNLDKGTGCTVILCPDGTRASAYARGVSPGTREYALLSPNRKMESVNAVLLTGGSAFGLDASAGVMRYLSERGIGYYTPFRNIPIVPAAVIFDLPVIDSQIFPTADDAYYACQNAKEGNGEQGTVGAGTGATVGKWAGIEHIMKGGTGLAQLQDGELIVEVLSIINPVGDVVDKTGRIIAGACQDGKFLAEQKLKRFWVTPTFDIEGNTILGAVMTNANLTKQQLYYLAERTHNGIVRSVKPAHTSYDGDIIFTVTTPEVNVKIDLITEMAIEAMSQSIVDGVTQATSLGGIPSQRNS